MMRKRMQRTKGAALVEYGVLVGLIAVLAIVAVLNLGGTVRTTFNEVSSTLSESIASAQSLSGAGEVDPDLAARLACEEGGGVWLLSGCAA